MKIDPFLNCVKATGINTGVSILGVYSFSSGNNQIIWNQIYTTGSNYANGYPYRSALPLIFNGSGNQTTGNFNKNSFYQIADVFTNSFSCLISMNYSGCFNSGTINYLLAATNPNPNGTTSGVYLGITPSNRLFIKTNSYSYTVPKEIGANDFAFFNITSNRFLNFGLYNLADNTFYGKNYDAGAGVLEVKDLTFGGALSYPTNFTGYSGKLNEIYLYSGTLNTGTVAPCVECSYMSGYINPVTQFAYTQTQITGSYWTGIAISGVTGTQLSTIQYPLLTGGSGTISYNSGVSGQIVIYTGLIPLTTQTTVTGYYTGFAFGQDNSPRINGSTFDVILNAGVLSGDVVEVYTYPSFNTLLNIDVFGFLYPSYGGGVQLFGNGLSETIGTDYGVAFNKLIIGFHSDDILLADLGNTGVTMNYITGNILTGATDSNYFRITGASNVNFTYPFQYDIYFNGQKMASGVDYSIVPTGINGVGIVSNMSGAYNPSFYDINQSGGDYLEIKFLQKYANVNSTIFNITGTQYAVSGLTGFSEQVWINGIRQKKNLNYVTVPRCRFCSGQYIDPNYNFSLYNSAIDTIGLFQ